MNPDAQARLVRYLNLAAAVGVFVIGITLWGWGQPLISKSGEVHLWVNSIWSAENSQQVADWYSLSHVVQGMLVGVVARLVGGQRALAIGYAAAIVIGVGWEVIEHTDWVMDRFRATTIYKGYWGDTVLNAVADYIFMLGGFFVASKIRPLWTIALMAILEVASALIARDSLILATIRVLHPIPAISEWQNRGDPGIAPAGTKTPEDN